MLSSDRIVALIDLALRKKAPRNIPRSGDEAKTVDCFVVAFVFKGDRYLVDSRDGNWLECRKWVDGAGYAAPDRFNIFDLYSASPEIRHYLGYYNVDWKSWEEFSLDQRTRWVYAKVRAQRARDYLGTLIATRRKLQVVERFNVLKAVWELQVARGGGVNYLEILRHVHGDAYFLRPRTEAESNRMSEVIDALVGTGELVRKSSLELAVSGAGLALLERMDQDDRRHRDSMSTHRRMFWLTLALVLSALVQAGLVKLPAIWQLDGWPWQSPPAEPCKTAKNQPIGPPS